MLSALTEGGSMGDALKSAAEDAQKVQDTFARLVEDKSPDEQAVALLAGDFSSSTLLDDPRIQQVILDAVAGGEPMELALARVTDPSYKLPDLAPEIPDTPERLMTAGGNFDLLLDQAVERLELTDEEWRIVQRAFEDRMLEGLQQGASVTDSLSEAEAVALQMRDRVLSVRLQKNESDTVVITAAKGGTLSGDQLENFISNLNVELD